MSKVNLDRDWLEWEPSPPVEIIKPEKDYEGFNCSVEKSSPGSSDKLVHQLRDPAIY